MATESNPTKVVTGIVRLSYAHVFEPWSGQQGQEPKYSACLLIPKSDKKTISKIKAAIEAAKERDKAKWNGKVPTGLKISLRDGDEELESGAREGEEYAGHYFMNVSSKQRPGVVDADVVEILDPNEVYSGCYVRASINAFGYNANGNRGISFGLNHIQKISDGEPLGGGRTKAEDDFTAYETTGSDDLLG